MMILAFFGDNHQIQSQVVHYLDQTIKGFVIDHIDNDSKHLSVDQKIGGFCELPLCRLNDIFSRF
ncbi:hypothetical protein CRA15_005024 [Escherichia coli]|nr:hypothetical protein [Escherichia coli]EFC5347827.1 hypothetical protein [Escherichia coli]EIH2566977.1 hypothetical protein [Escherichia coli]